MSILWGPLIPAADISTIKSKKKWLKHGQSILLINEVGEVCSTTVKDSLLNLSVGFGPLYAVPVVSIKLLAHHPYYEWKKNMNREVKEEDFDPAALAKKYNELRTQAWEIADTMVKNGFTVDGYYGPDRTPMTHFDTPWKFVFTRKTEEKYP